MISYQDPNKENWFLISWTLSNKCNYRCSYCPDYLHNGQTGQPRFDTVERFIKGFNQPGKEICYRVSGGEPTYWKHFIDMARTVSEQGHIFSFLTNGSQSVEYYKDISKYTDGMIISYHPEYSNVDHFIEIANVMDCPVSINLMMVPEQFDTLLSIAERLFNNTTNLMIWPKVILDKSNVDAITNNVSDYTDEQRAIIKSWPYDRKLSDYKLHRGNILLDGNPITANELIIQGQNQYQGWSCYGGLDMISIDMWGNMYRSDCKVGGALGNIERWALPSGTIKCTANKCSCLSDIYLRKSKV
jgi:organic radical activating enzyme